MDDALYLSAAHAVVCCECRFHVHVHFPLNMLLFLCCLKFFSSFFSLRTRVCSYTWPNTPVRATNAKGKSERKTNP